MKQKALLKKMSALVLGLCLLLGLVACGGGTSSSLGGSSAVVPSGGSGAPGTKVYKIGIIQLIENGAFTDMREGFIARLDELGYKDGDTVELDYQNAQGDIATLNNICQSMVDAKKDLIVTIATPPSQAALQTITAQGANIPLVFISVSNPVGAGLIDDMATPDKNATGTSNAIPIGENFKLAETLTPGIETYGFLYTTGEVNAVATIDDAKAYCDANGLKYVEKVVTNSSEVQQAAQALAAECDAMFIPNDSVIQSAMPQVAQVAMDAKVPVYGSSAVMVASGAFATISISDTEIGAVSADMAVKVLEGTPVSEVPAVVVDTFTTVINVDTAAALGVEIPADVLENAVLLEGVA